jgi:hypothetical protein
MRQIRVPSAHTSKPRTAAPVIHVQRRIHPLISESSVKRGRDDEREEQKAYEVRVWSSREIGHESEGHKGEEGVYRRGQRQRRAVLRLWHEGAHRAHAGEYESTTEPVSYDISWSIRKRAGHVLLPECKIHGGRYLRRAHDNMMIYAVQHASAPAASVAGNNVFVNVAPLGPLRAERRILDDTLP